MNITTARPWRPAPQPRFRWWMPVLALAALAAGLVWCAVLSAGMAACVLGLVVLSRSPRRGRLPSSAPQPHLT